MMQYPKLVEVKTLANKVTTIEWNPRMDLLAMVFSTGALTCCRLLSLQMVWHKPPDGRISSIAWRPDGRVLAIAAFNGKTKENICTLHDVENGKELNSIAKDKAISSVAWFQYAPKSTDEIEKGAKKTSSFEDTSCDTFSHQLAHEQSQLSILVISTEDGRVSFYALGLFYLGNVIIHADNSSILVDTHMSNCLRYITTLVNTKFPNETPATNLRVLKLETFHRRSKEILKVAKMYAKITDELEYLDDTMTAITTSWADVLAGLDSKLSTYCSRKNKKSIESRGGYTFLSADELLQLLVIGFPSDNLEKFLTDMSDKGLKKLNNAIEQTCLRVQNLIVKNAQKCCYHLHGDLNLLRGMALWRDRFAEVGLDDKFIVESMRSVGSFVLKLTELQQVIDHSLKSTKSFFRWLISIAYRMSGEQNNSVVPNDINKTTQQDIQLITDFILENFDYNSNQDDLDIASTSNFLGGGTESSSVGDDGVYSNRPTCSNFTLEQVGQYFKNESLSRQKYSFTKPDSNFWIEFYRQKPELTAETHLDEDGSTALLFYQHNAETSLVQEHKKTCKSIESAFQSVATNIKTVSNENDDFFISKQFMRNPSTSRVCVEIDLKTRQHLTLFQTKSKPITKHYLLAQSLEDKSFKVLAIEFQAAPPKHASTSKLISSPTNLRITGSDFLDSERTKKLFITFLLLDESLGDTLIVQVEVRKLLEIDSLMSRSSKETTKIFGCDEDLEKYCSQVLLELDIHTEPACERKNDLDIVVKKIKNTVGEDIYSSGGRDVIAITSYSNKRLHLYELEVNAAESDIMDDEVDEEEKIDESLIDAGCIG